MTEPSRFKTQAAVGFISVIALSASALVAVLVVERQASSKNRRIMTEYRREVGAAHQLELGAERLVAAARGYLLSGEPEFLATLDEARREFDASVRRGSGSRAPQGRAG